jgi:hypothetical protein
VNVQAETIVAMTCPQEFDLFPAKSKMAELNKGSAINQTKLAEVNIL